MTQEEADTIIAMRKVLNVCLQSLLHRPTFTFWLRENTLNLQTDEDGGISSRSLSGHILTLLIETSNVKTSPIEDPSAERFIALTTSAAEGAIAHGPFATFEAADAYGKANFSTPAIVKLLPQAAALTPAKIA